MAENEELLNHLEKTIDQLIEISEFLGKSFTRMFTHEELKVLRERQTAMQEQMARVEKTCHQYMEIFSSADIGRLDLKIARFQKLNQELLEKFNHRS